MEVKGIGSASHNANQYARIDLFLPGKDGLSPISPEKFISWMTSKQTFLSESTSLPQKVSLWALQKVLIAAIEATAFSLLAALVGD